MSIFALLKPASRLPEIQDQEVVKKEYQYWRMRVFYGMYVGYIFYYFTRKSFIFASPALIQDLGLKMSDIGIVSSVLSISYGLSKFLSGVIADRSNPRYFMAFGLIVTGVLNICFGFTSSLFFFALFWGLNGWFQGWGWPPCARLLTHWYSQKERGRWWGFMNTSLSLGGALISLLVAFCVKYFGWRFALFIPGALCIGVGFFLMNRLRDVPETLGLPPIEKFKNDYSSAKRAEEKPASVKEILFTHVLNNKYIWVLAISYFFIYAIRQAINDFGPLFLIKTKGYSLLTANFSVVLFEVGGMCGSLTAGWASDVIFKGRRGPINVLFSAIVVGAMACFYFAPPEFVVVNYVCMFLVGFFVFGPQMLIGMAAAEMTYKSAAATANGFACWWSYLGAAAAGYPIMKITEIFGWQGFFLSLAICGAAAVFLLLPLWNIKTNPKYAKPAPAN